MTALWGIVSVLLSILSEMVAKAEKEDKGEGEETTQTSSKVDDIKKGEKGYINFVIW